jgi:hypothetical protein
MARVYRDMRHGCIETQDGTRLVYVLTQITKTIQAAELGPLAIQLAEIKRIDFHR